MNNIWKSYAFGVAIVLAVGVTTSAEPVPGLVAEEPKEGPFVKTDKGYMVPYTETIPGTDIAFEMIPIPAGEFVMGSPEDEADRNEDEGPQFRVTVEPFWMARHELTWREYKRFMEMYDVFKKFGSNSKRDASGEPVTDPIRPLTEDNRADAVTIPTPLYDASTTFERGEGDREPAVTMTPYAARQYTKWLSLQLGQFYRLPSEAEWEYACRAGTTTAFSFGDDPEQIEEYAWYWDNSLKELPNGDEWEAYHDVGSKKPNPWGLYDMHGNVAELVLDEYREDHYEQFTGRTVNWKDAIAWPTKAYPRVHRGGSWNSDAKDCRSAVRGQTHDEDWKIIDPNRPKSPWWFTEEDSRAVGMRLIRPLNDPGTSQERNRYWEEVVEEINNDVARRLEEGRGVLAPIDPNLPKAIEEQKKSSN